MGRRKKRRRIVKKTIKMPLVFECPSCGSRSLSVVFKKEGSTRRAIVSCSKCGLYYEFESVPSLYQASDVYNKFVDLYEEGKITVKYVLPEAGESSESEEGRE
ncbi:MAG: hypothetical protein OWQ48_06070 [Desulfurococcus sp.]|nr:hypothetical protein [Desulfurococcus sp.]